MPESKPSGIIVEHFYITNGCLTVVEVITNIERQLSNNSEKCHLLNYEIIRLEITAGLPKLDYGQEVSVSFLAVDKREWLKNNLPNYDTRVKGKLLMGS